ncbi:helix-turn-helix domain-containing protein [Streptomyces daliensis]|uniref:Helix-turn-helix domain-containing protein n=1 Tax=Streptomyces daliensis TaxID=299421 RepID=A0A8T4IJM3_9ACTN|nr:helix-turn-helix domain-containing protein [Streptomyces daliensis]
MLGVLELQKVGHAHYLTTAEVAARYRTAASMVRYWRHIGYGPKGMKVGRRVLYPEDSVEEFARTLKAERAS